MATLTDAFLADLDDLSDGDNDIEEPKEEDIKDEKDTFAEELAALPVDDVSAVAKLSTSARFKETLQEVDAQVALHGDAMPASWAGPSDADPTYRLIVACNELAMVVDDEIAKVHAYIQEKYRKRFPELEGLVLDPLAYARVVARIGNEESVIDIEDIVPRHVQMTVSVSASTTDGQPLSESDLRRVMDACAMMEQLYADREKLIHFVSSRMALVAPNLSAVCGANVAAKLVGAAGGLERLSEIPACNIQVLGQKKKISAGLSTRNVGLHQGYIFSCPIVTSVPPDYQQKAAKLIANKVTLLARYDAFGNSEKRNGEQGARMKAEVEKALEKRMEPPPAPIAKPLPAPDGVSKKRRGGRRWRKQKERAAATEMMKQANRMQFGTVEEEYLNGDEMYGLGMLGKDGHGKLKIMQAASNLSKKGKVLQKAVASGPSTRGSAGGLLSGTQSSLAFSAVQGIELENPDREHDHDLGGTRTSGTESYFSELSGFKTFRKIM